MLGDTLSLCVPHPSPIPGPDLLSQLLLLLTSKVKETMPQILVLWSSLSVMGPKPWDAGKCLITSLQDRKRKGCIYTSVYYTFYSFKGIIVHNSQITKYAVLFTINSYGQLHSHGRLSLIFAEIASIPNLWLPETNESSSAIKLVAILFSLRSKMKVKQQ